MNNLSKTKLTLNSLGGIVVAGFIVTPSSLAVKWNNDLQEKPKEITKEVKIEVVRTVKEEDQEAHAFNEILKQTLQQKGEQLNEIQRQLDETKEELQKEPEEVINEIQIIETVSEMDWDAWDAYSKTKQELQDKEKDLLKRERELARKLQDLKKRTLRLPKLESDVTLWEVMSSYNGALWKKEEVWKEVGNFVNLNLKNGWGDYGLYLCAWKTLYRCWPFQRHNKKTPKTLNDLKREFKTN